MSRARFISDAKAPATVHHPAGSPSMPMPMQPDDHPMPMEGEEMGMMGSQHPMPKKPAR